MQESDILRALRELVELADNPELCDDELRVMLAIDRAKDAIAWAESTAATE